MVRGRTGKLYCGITKDLDRRVQEHNTDPARASKAAWAMRPVVLVWSEPHQYQAHALRREAMIKRMKKSAKEALVAEAKARLEKCLRSAQAAFTRS